MQWREGINSILQNASQLPVVVVHVLYELKSEVIDHFGETVLRAMHDSNSNSIDHDRCGWLGRGTNSVTYLYVGTSYSES